MPRAEALILNSRRIVVLSLLAALAASATASALPVDVETAVVAGPGAFVAGYVTPAMAIVEGGKLTFVNGDLPRHDVVSVEFGPDSNPWCLGRPVGRCPLFMSAAITGGQSAPVRGVELLEAGTTYEYYCSLHHNMRGTLAVGPAVE